MDQDVFVLDGGTHTFRAGRAVDFPCDEEPRVILPSAAEPSDDKEPGTPLSPQPRCSDSTLRQVYDVNGKIQDWEAYETVASHILYDNLGWPQGDEGSIMSTESFITSRDEREKITQLMFETFNVAGYYVVDSSVASLYAAGRISGVVVDVGHSSTCVSQILDGALQVGMTTQLSLGGLRLNTQLAKIAGPPVSTLTAKDLTAFREEVTTVQESSEECDVLLPEVTKHTLPDGQEVSITNEGRNVGELLFRPHQFAGAHALEREPGIAEAAYACAMVPSEIAARKVALESFILCGGCSSIPGLQQRFIKDLRELSALKSAGPAMALMPDYMPSKGTHYAAFMGAAVLSKIVGSNHFISKADYEDFGPSVVHKKC